MSAENISLDIANRVSHVNIIILKKFVKLKIVTFLIVKRDILEYANS